MRPVLQRNLLKFSLRVFFLNCHRWKIFLGLFLLLPTALFAMAQERRLEGGNFMPVMDEKRLEGSVHAPDFPSHLEWLNAGRKFSIQDFQGKVVLLDFWTFCCIHCMHVLPDLKRLEEKYPNELVVAGVHSAKFENEKQTESIRQAIQRYEITHPVINDYDMEVWNRYAVNSWPTLVLVNPNGRIIGTQSGEGIFEIFDPVIRQTIAYFDRKGQINRQPLPLILESSRKTESFLSFPGKIRADQKQNLLYITDSNHHRILKVRPDGAVLDRIGSSKQGSADGSFESAEFRHPQGVFPAGDLLYIADTENHLVRVADLKNREVKTLLGTGRQAHRRGVSGTGMQVDLNSPWDLWIHENKLYIAMAGPHQIYVTDLQTLSTEPYAGSGREARRDGPLKSAALAQPSGLASDGKKLYFADSETSSIRAADLNPQGRVETIIGEDLFEFGDIDGDRRTARLQHALGVEYAEGKLFVADTYNSKIKILDPVKKTSLSFAGTGRHGNQNGMVSEAQFFEPGGLTYLDGKLYVADTNNHLIRVIDLSSRKVTTLDLQEKENSAAPNPKLQKKETHLEPQILKEGDSEIRLSFQIPEGYKLNEPAPNAISWKSANPGILQVPGTVMVPGTSGGKISFPIKINLKGKAGKTELHIDAFIYYCTMDEKICLFKEMNLVLPVEISGQGNSQVEMNVPIR